MKIKRNKIIENLDTLSDEDKEKKLINYLTILNENKDDELSIGEKFWIYRSIHLNYLYFKNELWSNRLLNLEHERLKDVKFFFLFIYSDYAHDINGFYIHFQNYLKGTDSFTNEENIRNVSFLQDIKKEWKIEVMRKANKGTLLYEIIKEYKNELRLEFRNLTQMGEILRETKKSQFLLFYKYAYLKGQLIFQQEKQFLIPFREYEIVFDYETFAHMHRHGAEFLKFNPSRKSFFSQDFWSESVVQLLTQIFQDIQEHDIDVNFNVKRASFFFEFNSVVYRIWFELKQDGKGKEFVRISTLYPSTFESERQLYSKCEKIRVNNNLYFFQKTT